MTHLLTVDDLVLRWRVPRTWVVDHCNRTAPRIPCVKMGRKVRFRPEDIERFEREHLVGVEEQTA